MSSWLQVLESISWLNKLELLQMEAIIGAYFSLSVLIDLLKTTTCLK